MYYITETTTATGCNKSDSVTITVNPLPAASHITSTAICNGGSISIGAASVTGSTYSWTSKPSGYTSTSSNPSVSPSATTVYYVTETITATGCNKSDSLKITVNPLPAASHITSTAICNGSSISIGAASVTGSTYSWTSKPSGYTSTSSNPSVSPTVTTVYYVTETITATGCNKSDSVTITVNPLPAASHITSTAICNGSSISIGAASVTGSTYSWTSKPSGYTSTSSNPSVSPSATTVYYVTETITATGCQKSDSVTITVNPLPAASHITSTAICNGSSISIGAASVTGSTYSWTSKPSGYTSTSSNPSVSPTANTVYYVTETITATGCNKSDSLTITVNPLPAPSINGVISKCFGTTGAYYTALDKGASYNWTLSGGSIISGSGTDSITIQWNTVGINNVKVVETSAMGCKDSVNTNITVNPNPKTNIIGKNNVCAGSNINYTTKLDTGASYVWNIKGGVITSSSSSKDSIQATWGAAGTANLFVRETNKYGCVDSTVDTVQINATPQAKFSNIKNCQGTASNFIDSSSTHSSQIWYFGNGDTSAALKPNYTYAKAGLYTASLVVKTAAGCTDSTSRSVEIDSTPNAHWTTKNAGNNSYHFIADDSLYAPNTYQWSFGDGATGNGYKVSHTYPTDTLYHVHLAIMNTKGCTGSFDSSIKVITGIAEVIKNVFDLSIYPNPFKESTTLQYSLARAEKVRVEVFALDGRQIAVLTDAMQMEGLHRVTFNAADYPTVQTMYLMRLIVGNQTVTKQIIRLK